jgi:hypothetical protein
MHFGSYIPPQPGRFKVVVWASDTADPFHANDTARWNFKVLPPSEIGSESEHGEVMEVALRPQPASGTATILYHLVHPDVGTITLHDAPGSVVLQAYAGRLEREGELAIDLGRLPSGTYLLRLRTVSGELVTRRISILR